MCIVSSATSGCEGDFIAALTERELSFSRVNPRQMREFARASGLLGKIDRVDAARALMGASLDLPVTVPDRILPSPCLADSLRRCRQLVEEGKAARQYRHSARLAEIHVAIDATIDLLSHQVADLDRSIASLVSDHHYMAGRARLLRAVPAT